MEICHVNCFDRKWKNKAKQANATFVNNEQANQAVNVNDNINKKENIIKEKYGEFKNISLTNDEYEKIKKLFPIDYEERIQKLVDYIQSSLEKPDLSLYTGITDLDEIICGLHKYVETLYRK